MKTYKVYPEALFKELVRGIVKAAIYPSPSAIREAQGRPGGHHTLNGRECDYREEVLKELGWKYVGGVSYPGRYTWHPPRGTVVMALDSGMLIGAPR